MRPPMYAGLSLSLTGTSASGQRPIFVPVTSVSHESAASCGSWSQRSSAVWHTPAGTPACCRASIVS